jgi:hypothetical protein
MTCSAVAGVLLAVTTVIFIWFKNVPDAVPGIMFLASMILGLIGALIGVVAWNRNTLGAREIKALVGAVLYWTLFATSGWWAALIYPSRR